MKDLSFKHFVDDSQKCDEFRDRFIAYIEKLKRKGKYLILDIDTGMMIVRPTEINAIYIYEEKPPVEAVTDSNLK